MVKKKKEKTFYKYQCTLTGEEFITTKAAAHPDELMSVKAYYDMHPEDDDRPKVMKLRLGLDESQAPKPETSEQ